MKELTVKASVCYNIFIGNGLISECGRICKNIFSDKKIALITDTKTFSLYSGKVKESLENCGFSVYEYAMPEGEENKTPKTLFRIISFLSDNNFTRKDTVIALGGGVVGDTAGLAAALYMRGIRFIQIPTTVIAAVDSSIGGKTAVNTEKGKNIIGAFHQPSLVICDTDTLKTLPKEIYDDGFAEIIKYAMIADYSLFDKISDKKNIEEIIYTCDCIKKDAVEKDEFDGGCRMLLNFGHTLGHAVEKISNYKLSHGKSVSIGMAMITKACVKSKKCPEEIYNKLIKSLNEYNLPTESGFSAEEIFNSAVSDKKSTGNGITLILPTDRGRCELYKATFDELKTFIRLGLQ